MSTKTRATVIGTVCAFGLLAAACGGSPGASVANLGTGNQPVNSTSGTSGASGASGASGGGLSGGNGLAMSQCMRKHGISDFPDPNSQGEIALSGGPGSDLNPNNPQFQAAQRACAAYRPKASPQQIRQAEQNALAMSRCMRAHGVTNYPDPKFSSTGGARIQIGNGSGIDPNNPQFQRAQQACSRLLHLPGPPKVGPGAGGGKGSGGEVQVAG